MSDRIPLSPPVIEPLQAAASRPLWSVMIPAYNCITYLRQTMESVLRQDPGREKMQIEVVDDGSTDGDVEALVQEVGKGRIGFFRQEKNRGSLRNFETCLNRSKGYLVHLLHGDDLVLDGFYTEMEKMFHQFPQIGAGFTRYRYIDHAGTMTLPGPVLLEQPGIIKDFLSQIAQKQMVQAVAMVVKREVYEQLGSFFAVHYGEDWEMWIRIAAHYEVAYSPACLAVYRGGQGHAASITSSFLSTGQNIRDITKVIDIVQSYLPREKRRVLKKLARMNFSRHYAKASHNIYHYNPKAAFVQANGALKMNQNIKTVYWVVKLYLLHCRKLISTFNYSLWQTK
ncbi:glycosyltransferase [Paraflavitalea sp. CAU 1676]|uniref:glycosyltransferase n=1 Tax=Paraflavitalea sp. CAU 1676 TaxID=3032598 RepID=UPI0023DB7157|nr:glycosyltransferase [Paraflavitalea sp. CAU 1676]MDF2188463.1 glycosyltransferase [Paraflavitalea sp. CAU 1676]